MSSILPKGIVVNTPEISGDIKKIDREPLALEEIAKFWKVYTTTKRRLVDPTAERLENFWWRIWGSRKRNLKGATVARMFGNISDEMSFVPLRGPLNRDESGGRPTTSFNPDSGTASTTAIYGRLESDSSNSRHSSSLSASVAALPPPILKKSRGPSSTGPRPTARFISPQTSEEEDAAIESLPLSGTGAHVIVRPPTPPTPVSQRFKDEKLVETSAGPSRKARGSAATNATEKRRSGATRRPNAGSTTRMQKHGSTSSNKNTCQSLPKKPNEQSLLAISQNQLSVHEQTSTSPETLLSVNASRKPRFGKNAQSKGNQQQSFMSKSDLEHNSGTSSQLHGLQDEPEILDEFRPAGKKQSYLQKGTSIDNDFRERDGGNILYEGCPASLPAINDQSVAAREPKSPLLDNKMDQHRPLERRLPKNFDSKSSISMAPTYPNVAGEIGQRGEPVLETSGRQAKLSLDDDRRTTLRDPEQTPLFAKRPVKPTKSASALFSSSTHQINGSMSRSKSQLTLLLERDRAREREKNEQTDSVSKTKDAKPI